MSSPRNGSQRPTRSLLPVGVATSVGPDIVELAAIAGLYLDDWQRWFLENSLLETGRRWTAFEVALLVPRQNGKGALLEARQLGGLFYLREPLQVHTAHEFKTAYEHFLRITNLIEGCPDMDRQVMRIRRGAGEQAIELKTGERLRFLARSTGSGRGMTGDVVYLDEAFALTTPMMGALLPTLSAVPNPQIWYTSSAPRSTSDVLHGLRNRDPKRSPRLFFAEWGYGQDVDIEDEDAWYGANPALGIRIDEEFVRSELDALRAMPEEFRRERLGVPEMPVQESIVVPESQWESLTDTDSKVAERHCFALDVAADRSWSAFGVAGLRADGRAHIEVVDTRPGTGWVLDVAQSIAREWSAPIRIQTNSPAASFIDDLRSRGVEVVEMTPTDHAEAVGRFLDAIENDGLRHIRQGSLLGSLKAAVLRTSGDASVWARRTSRADISPLVAVTLALGGVAALVPVGTPSFVSLDDWED
jgi:hypothetical protein